MKAALADQNTMLLAYDNSASVRISGNARQRANTIAAATAKNVRVYFANDGEFRRRADVVCSLRAAAKRCICRIGRIKTLF